MTDGPGRGEIFVSESVMPEAGTFDVAAMARGEPGLPRSFVWRGRRFEVAEVVGRWKTSGRERGELYLRRHWFDVRAASGECMTLYCERQAKNRKNPKARWWLYKVVG